MLCWNYKAADSDASGLAITLSTSQHLGLAWSSLSLLVAGGSLNIKCVAETARCCGLLFDDWQRSGTFQSPSKLLLRYRYRDVCEEVRAIVVEGIGNWVEMMPATFLQDSYLKYLAWALSDKVMLLTGSAASWRAL